MPLRNKDRIWHDPSNHSLAFLTGYIWTEKKGWIFLVVVEKEKREEGEEKNTPNAHFWASGFYVFILETHYQVITAANMNEP